MNIKYLKNMHYSFLFIKKWLIYMFFYVKVNALNIPPDDYDSKIKS